MHVVSQQTYKNGTNLMPLTTGQSLRESARVSCTTDMNTVSPQTIHTHTTYQTSCQEREVVPTSGLTGNYMPHQRG